MQPEVVHGKWRGHFGNILIFPLNQKFHKIELTWLFYPQPVPHWKKVTRIGVFFVNLIFKLENITGSRDKSFVRQTALCIISWSDKNPFGFSWQSGVGYTFFYISISKFQLRLGDAYFWGKIFPISPPTLPVIVCLKCFWGVTLSFHVEISFLTTIFLKLAKNLSQIWAWWCL